MTWAQLASDLNTAITLHETAYPIWLNNGQTKELWQPVAAANSEIGRAMGELRKRSSRLHDARIIIDVMAEKERDTP